MKKRIMMLLAIMIIMSLSVSTASADDNVTADISINEQTNTEITTIDNNQTEQTNQNNPVGTFDELDYLIQNTIPKTTLKLEKNYTGSYDVWIDKSITIDGQGHTLNANTQSRIFHIDGCNVILKNLIFINGKSEEDGGAIYCEAHSNLTVINSTFINCYAQSGGAIYFAVNSTSTITDCKFHNNTANIIGGSVFAQYSNVALMKSNFTNSSAMHESGGALMLINSVFKAEYILISECYSEYGGAITLLSTNTTINHSSFKRNRAKTDGGAIYSMFDALVLDDNVFQDNSAQRAGAVYSSRNNLTIRDNKFLSNNAITVNSIYSMASNIIEDENNQGMDDFFQSINNNLTITSDDYYLFQYSFDDYTNLPDYYNLKDDNYVTSVKDQGVEGNCWAFSAMGALESAILKATGITFDFSEANIKNLMAKYSDFGKLTETNQGGNKEMASGYFASWLGPVYEEDDEYFSNDFLSSLLKSVLHIQNIIYLKRTDYLDNDDIKNAILRYGAVSTSMYYDKYYLNDHRSYYYADGNVTNHAVCIVGWDDNYSKYNFKSPPADDGAWIVKNSWGPSWGDNGYFYVSYYDSAFALVNESISYAFILNETVRLNKVYQFEMQLSSFYIFDDAVGYKNIFTVDGDEYLAAVSTYFADKCDYALEVYVNDNLVSSQNGNSPGGYRTFYLDEIIFLNKNENVTVVFYCTNFDSGKYLVPLTVKSRASNLFVEKNKSYLWRNNRWNDLYYSDAVACIKIFTTFANDNKFTPYFNVDCEGDYIDDSFLITFMLPNDATGLVELNTSNSHYVVNLSNSKSIKLYNLNENNNTLTIRYCGDAKYLDRTIFTTVNVTIPKNGTFEELSKRIDDAAASGVLNLFKDYICQSESIDINNPITIDGQGHTIIGAESRMFNIRADNVVLKNLKFINAYFNGSGGAVRVFGYNCSIINCSFINNNVLDNGGAIYWSGDEGTLRDCVFENNSADYAGAVLWTGTGGIIENCTFNNNHANYYSGSIYVFNDGVTIADSTFLNDYGNYSTIYLRGNANIIENCQFNGTSNSIRGLIYISGNDNRVINTNFTQTEGYAIYVDGNSTMISNSRFINITSPRTAIYIMGDRHVLSHCLFDNCVSDTDSSAAIIYGDDCIVEYCVFSNGIGNDWGGALSIMGDDGSVSYCEFINNEGMEINGGAIYLRGNNFTILNNTFINNSAFRGGAIYISGSGSKLLNSSFITNYAKDYGGAIFWNDEGGIVSDCLFMDNNASSGGSILWYGGNGNLYNSTFVNNLGNNQIYWYDDTGNITGCRFINTTRGNVKFYGENFNKQSFDLNSTVYTMDYQDPSGLTIRFEGMFEGAVDMVLVLKISNKNYPFHIENNTLTISNEQLNHDTGEMTVNVMFEGDDTYNALDSSFKLIIQPAKSQLTIEAANTTVNHQTVITAHVSDSYNRTLSQGRVTFYDGETIIGVRNVVGGVASISYTPTRPGEHSITAVFAADNYRESSDETIILADDVIIEIPDYTGIVGFENLLTVNVSALYSIVDEGSVTFYIDDYYIRKVMVENGVAEYAYVPLKAGTFTIKVVFGESDRFSQTQDTSTYNVEKANSTIMINPFNATVGHASTITVEVTSDNNRIVNEGSVTLYEGEKIIGKSNVENGAATISYTPASSGQHSINAIYTGNNYLTSNDSFNLLIDDVNVEVFDARGTVGYGNAFIVNVNALYSVVDDGSVSFYINDNFIGKSSIENGVSRITHTPLNAGTFTVKAVYGESDKFRQTQDTATYTVEKATSAMQIDEIMAKVGHATTIRAKITSDNNMIINDGSVAFYHDKVFIGRGTVKNAVATVSYTPKHAGKHNISAVFESGNYEKSTNYIIIDVEKANVKLDIADIDDAWCLDTVGLHITVSSNGVPVNEGVISYYVNDEFIGSSNVAGGKSNIDYDALASGSFELKVEYGQSDNYLGMNATKTFIVNKMPTSLSAKPLEVVYNVAGNLIISLKDGHGKTLNGMKLSVVFNGAKSFTTDSNGQIRLSINGLTPRICTVAVTYPGDGVYAKSTLTTKITVKKATPKITASKKTFKRKAKSKKYTITLKTHQNKAMVKVKLTVKVNGKKYSAKTNAKGKATFNLKKLTKKGTFKATITYNGNVLYNKVSKTVKIKIK